MTIARLTLAVALPLSVVACQPVAEQRATFTAQDEAEIRGLLEKFAVDLNAGDWASNVSYYGTEAVRMPPDESMIEGHAGIMAGMEAMPPVTGFTLTPQVIDGDGDLAYARGTFTLDLAPPDAAPVSRVGKWHGIYERKEDGSWLCISDIWNYDAPAAM
jgi:ketosteroid isomerase-like protein